MKCFEDNLLSNTVDLATLHASMQRLLSDRQLLDVAADLI